jgi:hypothetical protein
MAVLNPGHCKTSTGITSSSPAIPQARVLAHIQRRHGGRTPAGSRAGGQA